MNTLEALDQNTQALDRIAKRSLLLGSVSACGSLCAAGVALWLALHPTEITRIYAVDPWGHVSNGTARLVVEPSEREMATFAIAYLRDLREKTGVHDANVRRIQRSLDASAPLVQETVKNWLDRVDYDGLAARTLDVSSIEQIEPGRFRITWVEDAYSQDMLVSSEAYTAVLLIERKQSQAQRDDPKNIFGLRVSYLSWSPTLPEISDAS